VWLSSLTVTCRTCNPEVLRGADSTPHQDTAGIDIRQVVHTHVPLSPSSIIWYRLHRWDVNRHTAQYTGPISVVSQCKNWCLAEGLRKRRSEPPYGLGRDFTFFKLKSNHVLNINHCKCLSLPHHTANSIKTLEYNSDSQRMLTLIQTTTLQTSHKHHF